MIHDTDKIRVENRDNTLVGYIVPETNIIRRFNAYETKELSMGELRQMIQVKGHRNLIKNHLIIHNKEAVDELMPNAEPEYFYNAKDVDFLLERGSLDQLYDALDFAPEGVIQLIKDEAVRTNLNDLQKRQAILEKTGFDVTGAINIRTQSETVAPTENKARRATPIINNETTTETPTRRTSSFAPKNASSDN